MVSCRVEARILFPDSKTASNIIELGVEGISRICPTTMWDHWVLRDIDYDKESNTVIWVLQTNNTTKSKQEIKEKDIREFTNVIVSNVMKGYNEIIGDALIATDGDFMMYLGLGTPLKQMIKNDTFLKIILLQKDFNIITPNDYSIIINCKELKSLIQAER